MTGIDPDRLERRLRWAAEQLGLSPQASLEEVRAAWLRRLPSEDFVPSSELSWALATLLRRQSEGDWEARADEAASVEEEERLCSEVEAFAEGFWDLPPDERRRSWQALLDRCEFAPSLRARLRSLEAGLDCVPLVESAEYSARVVELANQVRELFLLRPGLRARVRQDFLCRIEGARKEWKSAAQYLRLTCPSLAALGGDLLDKIATAAPMPKALPKKPPPKPAATKSAEVSPTWLLWVLIGIVSGVMRLACTDKPSSPPTTRTSYPWELRSPPTKEGNKLPPDIWQPLTEKKPIQNEEAKKRAREILEEMEKNRKQEKKVDKKDKPGGKSP